jgi:hypothetical protein
LVAVAGELATNYGITGWNEGAAFESALTCFEQWRGYRGAGDTEGLQIIEAVTAYIEKYEDARFTSTNDDRVLHGERSGYWRDELGGRQYLFSKAGLQQATSGYDIKQVVNALKAAGMLIVDSEGKNTKTLRINSKSDRFYFIRFGSNSDIEKTGVTSVTGVTATNDAAYSCNTYKSESVTGVTKPFTASQSVTPVTPMNNEVLQPQTTNGAGVTPVTPVTPEKNNTQSETEEKINSRSNVFRI